MQFKGFHEVKAIGHAALVFNIRFSFGQNHSHGLNEVYLIRFLQNSAQKFSNLV